MRRELAALALLIVLAPALSGCTDPAGASGTGPSPSGTTIGIDDAALDEAESVLDEAERVLDAVAQEMAEDED